MGKLKNISRRYTFIASTVACSFVLFASTANAGPDNSCPIDQPCFTGLRQFGDKIVFRFDGVRDWEFYNVRYALAGGGEKQVENRSGSFTFKNTQPNRTYRLSVQGCNSHTFARSTCSPWAEASITTK
jgi:hypothetical protein